ncbi:hypothetical protein ACAW74_25650 [Fibrella sp. WM1]|uniref:hypothetical protein n=1 Tax=Fibrella musci TaxID=3242485 RepID=UPI00352140CE
MFDLISFIRQYLPPTWRKSRTIAMIQVLLSPITTLFTRAQVLSETLLFKAGAGGQVATLEYALNLAAGLDSGVIYIVDGNFIDHEFQIVVPATLSANVISQLRDTVDALKLPSKRYKVVTEIEWGGGGDPGTGGTDFAFRPGYPRIENGQIIVGLEPGGEFEIGFSREGVALATLPYTLYTALDEIVWPNDSALSDGLYKVTVRGLVVTPTSGEIVATITVGSGRVCDLAFDDSTNGGISFYANAIGAANTDATRQVEMYLRYYSAYPNLAPFAYIVQKSDGASVVTRQGFTTNPIRETITLAPGNYRVRGRDKDGCMTSWKEFTVPVYAPEVCDLAWALNNPLQVVRSASGHNVTVRVTSTRSGIAPYTVRIRDSSNNVLQATEVTTMPATVAVPSSISGGLTIEVSDAKGCLATARPLFFPANSAVKGAFNRYGPSRGIMFYLNPPDDAGWSVTLIGPSGNVLANLGGERLMTQVVNEVFLNQFWTRMYQYNPPGGTTPVEAGTYQIVFTRQAEPRDTITYSQTLTNDNTSGELTNAPTQPPPGEEELTSRTFTGRVEMGWQTDPNYLNVVPVLGNDGIVRVTNSASFSVPGDRLLKYVVNGGVLDSLSGWQGLPGEPTLILMLFVRPSDPDYTERGNSSIHIESSFTVY